MAEEIVKRAYPGWTTPGKAVLLCDLIEYGRSTARAGLVPHLLAFWSDLSLGDVTRASCWAYEDFRREQSGLGRGGRDGPAIGTIRNELANFATMIRSYCDERGIVPVPRVYLPADEPTARTFLRVHEIRRLLGAAEGQTWNVAADDWLRCEVSGEIALRDEATRTRLAPMLRLVRFLIWTGSRLNSVLRATWSRRGDRGWVDTRIGVLFRRGEAERVTSKGRPPVRLVDELRHMTEVWAREDAAAGTDHVVHDAAGGPIGDARARTLFLEIVQAAGLDGSVTPRTLRSSCAIWLMEAGLSPEEAAAFLGNTAGVLSGFYDHYDVTFSHAAADALDSRAF